MSDTTKTEKVTGLDDGGDLEGMFKLVSNDTRDFSIKKKNALFQ